MKNQIVLSILQSNKYCTLSTVNEDGTPHGSPVFFVYDNNAIFWWSAKDSQHSRNIGKTGKAFITLFDSNASEEDVVGVYVASDVEVVDNGLDTILDLYNKKAETFKLEPRNVSGASPSRIYKAVIKQLWINSNNEIDGNYIDEREEVK